MFECVWKGKTPEKLTQIFAVIENLIIAEAPKIKDETKEKNAKVPGRANKDDKITDQLLCDLL